MRYVVAACLTCGLAVLFQPNMLSAEPLDLNTVIEGETPEELCDRLASDPFAGFGPEEWAQPFRTVDFYRAAPACTEAMNAHPGEMRFALGAAIAHIAGNKNETAKSLLEPLIAEGHTSAMLALAYISPEPEATALMRKAAEQGSTGGMILFGMSELTRKDSRKDEVDGVRMIRRAADAGSTRAMLILANFYNGGLYGVGYNPQQAKQLIAEAAERGDPAAKEMLASLSAAP